MLQHKFRVYCYGKHPTNLNFQKAGYWNLSDGILNKYYDMLSILSGNDDPEFEENFELHQYTGYNTSEGQEVWEDDHVNFYCLADTEENVKKGFVTYSLDIASFTVQTFNGFQHGFDEIYILHHAS